MRKILYFDTETTGTSPEKHGIIQFAAIMEVDGKEAGRINIKFQPSLADEIEPKALEVNKTTPEELWERPMTARDGYLAIKKFLCEHVNQYDRNDKMYPAGYNVRFDFDMVRSLFEKNGDKYFGSFFYWKPVDVLPILHAYDYLGKIKLENYKLSTVCQTFGIPIDAHDAMSDIEATRTLTNVILNQMIMPGVLEIPPAKQ